MEQVGETLSRLGKNEVNPKVRRTGTGPAVVKPLVVWSTLVIMCIDVAVVLAAVIHWSSPKQHANALMP
jgi:hypothetical protein